MTPTIPPLPICPGDAVILEDCVAVPLAIRSLADFRRLSRARAKAK